MKISYNKSVHENAAYYYDLAKKTREKIKGLEEAIEQTKKEIRDHKPKEKKVKIKREKEWFEKFNYSYTSSGRLIIGGRNSQQNDMVVTKYMEKDDLFFHADIQGGSVVVLKDGTNCDEPELNEAAQFAASFSKAWVNGNASVDVYSVRKEQLSKSESGGFVPQGAFAIHGERSWYRGTRLELKIGLTEGKVIIMPNISPKKLDKELKLVPSKSGKGKGSLAKSLSKRFECHPDELLEVLPNGNSRTVMG